jgi:hypothetical protein
MQSSGSPRRTLGRGLNCSQEVADGCKLNEGEEGRSEFVVAVGDVTELLKLVEEPLDEVALAVDGLLPAELRLPVGSVRNVGNGALTAKAGSYASAS